MSKQGRRRARFGGDQLKAIIDGSLQSAIDAHGPITRDNLGSAVKRLARQLRKAEFDQLWVTAVPVEEVLDVLRQKIDEEP